MALRSKSKRRVNLTPSTSSHFERLDPRMLLSAAAGRVTQSAATIAARVAGEGVAEHWIADQYVLAVRSQTAAAGFLTKPSTASPRTITLNYLRNAVVAAGLPASVVDTAIVTSSYADDLSNGGMTHTYLQQTFNGLPILNALANVSVDARGRIVAATNNFIDVAGATSNLAGVTPVSIGATLGSVASDLGIALARGVSVLSAKTTGDRATRVSAPDLADDAIDASLAYVAGAKGSLQLVWHTILNLPDHSHWYELGVNAEAGAKAGRVPFAADYVDNLIDGSSFDVYAFPTISPSDGSRTIVTDPADPTASPYGWFDTNGVAGPESTFSVGNNVSAQEDRDANNATQGVRSSGGASLTFDSPLDFTQVATTATNQSAAITNLFYLNNRIHDITYKYGFTDVAGNFQTNNYGRGGAGNDAVQADAQDGSGTNNANFATPADGSAGRMQMYLFTGTTPGRDGDLDATVVVHEYTHGISNRLTGGPANASALTALQSGGMGEGWGDWLALLLTMKSTDVATSRRPSGTYVLGQGNTSGAGIRRYPYSTDRTIDPLVSSTFNSSTEVHDAGEIWCTVLWDMTWNLIAKYGRGDINTGATTAGNQLALRLVLDGMKLQPANPSFKDARDAILAADQNLNGGADLGEIWSAFAGRGFGYSFGDTSASASSVVAAYDVPGQISGTIYNDANDNGAIDAGEVGQAGITAYLDANNNNVFDSGELNSVTDANGYYFFTGLPSATYSVKASATGFRNTGTASYAVPVTGPTSYTGGKNFAVTNKARIDGFVYNDVNNNGVKDAGEAGISGSRVYVDTNNNGTFDNSSVNQASTDVPKAILDVATVESSLTVSGAGNVGALTVTLSLTHTYDGDLDIFLIAPDGTIVQLADNAGGSGDNYTNTVFSDGGATTIGSGTAPFTGTFRPFQALSALTGHGGNGIWKLRITDTAAADTGTLTAWRIAYGSTEPNAITTASGAFSLPALSSGASVVRQVPLAAPYVFTTPVGGTYSFTLAAATLYARDFGNRIPGTAPTASGQTFQSETTPSVSVSFSDAVTVNTSNLLVVNTTTGTPLPAANLAVAYNAATNTATVTFPGYLNGAPPDGHFVLRTTSGIVSNPGGVAISNPGDFAFDFLNGDVDRNGTVGFSDLLIVSQNFGLTGRTFSQGNLDFSTNGTVDFADLLLLSQQYGTTLAVLVGNDTLVGTATPLSKRDNSIAGDVLA